MRWAGLSLSRGQVLTSAPFMCAKLSRALGAPVLGAQAMEAPPVVGIASTIRVQGVDSA